MSTKNNLSGYRLPPTLDALAFHLRRVLIFFHQYLFNIVSELFFSILHQKYKIYRKKFVYT